MSPMALREALRCSRRQLAIILVLLGLISAVSVHHGMPTDMHAMPGHAVCLALLVGAALLVAGAAVTSPRGPRSRPVDPQTPVTPSGTWCRSVPARAGPLYLRLAVLRL